MLAGAGVEVSVEYGDFVLASVSPATLLDLQSRGLVVRTLTDRTAISLGSVQFDTATGEPEISPDLRIEAYEEGARGLYLLQLVGPVKSEWVDALEDQGIRFFNYIPHFAFIVEMDPTTATGVASAPFVQWVGIYQPAYRISRLIYREFADVQALDAHVPTHRDVGGGLSRSSYLGLPALHASGTPLAADYRSGPAVGSRDFSVLVQGSAPEDTWEAIEEMAIVNYQWMSVGSLRLLRFSMDPTSLQQLANLAGVYWIEPFLRPQLVDEVSSQIVAGNFAPLSPGYLSWLSSLGLSGQNVTVAVADTGVDTGVDDPVVGGDMHPELDNRTVAHIPYGGLISAQDVVGHGTHVAGIIAGDDSTGLMDGDGFFWGLGIAPQAYIVNQRIFDDFGGWVFPDYYQMGREAYDNGTNVHSNSWRILTFGDYIIDDAIFDELVRDADNIMVGDQPIIFEFSAANDGPGSSTTGSPGNAKNVITTGASLNFRPTVPPGGTWPADDIDAIVGFSSRGPTTDGRIKPDIVAPGTWIASLLSSVSSPGWCWQNIDTYHEYCGGTSMSGPMVSGSAALFVEYYRNLMAVDPSPALTKAALVNGAVDMPPVSSPSTGSSSTGPIPNFDEGWGRIHLENLLNFTGEIFYEDQQQALDSGTTFTYSTPVARLDRPFKVSLAWTDLPGMPGVSPVLVNDLDLTVTAPGGTVYRGNNFNNGWSVPGGPPDLLNNLENVYISTTQLQLGVYTVNVTAVNVPVGDQDYAIVISHGGGPTSEGDVSWVKPLYKSSALADVVLADIDLNLDNGTQDSALVIATSDLGDSENVNLLEFGTASGVFGGNVQLTLAFTGQNDGLLTVVNAGTITATYNDANPPAVVTDMATIDDDAPIISNVQVTNVTHNSARITWLTDENATSVVRYNTTTPPDITVTNGLTTSHSVSLTPLQPNSTYLFEVESGDVASNTAVDDNGTAYYNFRTLTIPPILLVDDDFGNTFETYYIDALNALGLAFHYWDVTALGSPLLADIQGYEVLIWHTPSCGFNTGDQNEVAQYLDLGGLLILSGQDIGWCWASTSFYSNYLHAVFVADSAPTDNVVGVSGDPIGNGLDFFISGGDGANNNIWPSVVDPISPAVTSAQYASGPSTRSAILRVEDGAYSIAYLAFNFEGISTAGDRELLMDRLLDWIMPPDFGASLTPSNQTGRAVPGGTVNYPLKVRNRGIALANDTFTISGGGIPYGWTRTFYHSDGVTPLNDTNNDTVEDTGPIPSGGSIDIIVQVDVDPGATAGQADVLRVNTTSVADPTAFAQATITTLVPLPGVAAGPNSYEGVVPGASATFNVNVENMGGLDDVFQVTRSSIQGWGVKLFESDGTTPLADTDTDGTPDTGVVPGLQTTMIVVGVDVPSDAPLDTLETVTITATSTSDPGQSDDAMLRLEVAPPPSPEWPQFHHDRERSGIAPVPFELPLTQRWTAAAGGAGIRWSGPVIYNHTVFFTEQEGILNAVDIGTGEVKWQRTLGYAGSISGTPAVADGSVYAPFVTSGGSAISLFSLDADTGSTNWQADSFGGCCSAFTTPAVAVGNVYWSDYFGGTIHATDIVTGATLWSYFMGPAQTLQGPTYAAGMVFAADTSGTIVALDAFTGAQIWNAATMATITAAPTVVDGVLYVGDYSGSLYALDALTGAPVWTSSGLGLLIDVSSPAVANDMVFVGAFDFDFISGWIHALNATTGAPVWSNSIPNGGVGTSAGYNNGSVFLTTWDGNLSVWDAATGALEQTLSLTTLGSTSSVALGDGYLVVGDESGKVTGFSFVGAGVASRVDTSPDSADIVVGGTVQFDAEAFDGYDNHVSGTFTWTSVNALGTVFPLTPSGDEVVYIAGPTAGTDSLESQISTFTDSVTVTISPGPLEQVSISPTVVDVVAGGSLQFAATTQDRFGNPISGFTFTWSTSGGIGTIDATGSFTASTSTGAGTVRVSSDGLNATSVVRIVPGPLDQITVSPSTVGLMVGDSTDLIAMGTDQFDNRVSDVTFVWQTTIGSVEPSEAGWSAIFSAGDEAGTGTLTVSSGSVSTAVDVTVTAPVSPVTQLTQPLTIALLAAVAVLALVSVFLYIRYAKVKRASESTVEEQP